jgi:hypothetical protein|tara:strand:- start:393 stop:557 length:165 start_codon:yes stop_codon:yes gene_type:complete
MIYTPKGKEAHGRILVVAGGSFFARLMVAKEIASWGGELVSYVNHSFKMVSLSV